ncbi:MAG: DUF1552 domain-containing protein [Myxococcales bacterium]|nr:DUF1552 domain-containing protein [Myxococcales bacterium]
MKRRTFLRGAGSLALALPMLELTHSDAFAASGNGTAKRLIVLFSHGGSLTCRTRGGQNQDGTQAHHHWDLWKPPSESTTLTALGEEMQPLTSVTQHLLLLRGIDNRTGMTAAYGGGHRSSNASAMTAERWFTDNSQQYDKEWAEGPSVDQVIAQRLQKTNASPFLSVDLIVGSGGYGSPFYSKARTRVGSEKDPHAAFARFFANVQTGAQPDPQLTRLRALKQSVLDGLKDGIGAFQKQLGAADRQTLDQHLTHVRALEVQLAAIGTNTASCVKPNISNVPTSKPGADLVGPAMVDLIVHAMRCGLTQVATLQIGDLITGWLPTPTNIGSGHSLGHRAREIGPTISNPSKAALDWKTEALENRHWRMSLLERLIKGLDSVPEGNNSMLYNSAILFTSEFSTASVHSVRDVPMLLAGQAGGAWKTGRHINYNKKAKADPNTRDYDSDVSNHNVFTSVLQAFGFSDTHFGSDAAVFKGPLQLS